MRSLGDGQWDAQGRVCIEVRQGEVAYEVNLPVGGIRPLEEMLQVIVPVQALYQLLCFRFVQVCAQPVPETFFGFFAYAFSEFQFRDGVLAVLAIDGERERQIIYRDITVVGELHLVNRARPGQEVWVAFQCDGNLRRAVSWRRVDGIGNANGVFFPCTVFSMNTPRSGSPGCESGQ